MMIVWLLCTIPITSLIFDSSKQWYSTSRSQAGDWLSWQKRKTKR